MKLLAEWICFLICVYLCLFVQDLGTEKAPKIAQKVCRVFEMGSRTKSRTHIYTLPMAPFQLATKTDPIHQNAPSAKTWLFWCHEVACRVDLFPYLCLFVFICAYLCRTWGQKKHQKLLRRSAGFLRWVQEQSLGHIYTHFQWHPSN